MNHFEHAVTDVAKDVTSCGLQIKEENRKQETINVRTPNLLILEMINSAIISGPRYILL